jgi:TPP-dependent pyruvate/acetoin dehydrogenase alpha subunit
MVLMKAADDRLSKGIGTGEFMCVYWPSRGQEAIAAAMGVTLRDDDQLVTTYRGLHDLIGKGVPLEEIYGEMMGRTVGASRGKGGTMHIAKPEKGVMEMTPTTDTMKLEHVADRAAGYGMPGVRVDGNDPLVVMSALAEAIGKARNGDGPTFIECVTFRFRGHYFGDRMAYIPKDQLEAAMAADPVPAFRRHLIDTGVCSDDELSHIDEGALTKVEEALKTVLSAPPPSADELDRDVYATPIKFPV